MYNTLNRQIVDLDEQIEAHETTLYAPVSGDLSRVISSRTTKTGKPNSKISMFDKLDKLYAIRAFKREVCDEIESLINKAQPYLRPYICDIYLNGGTIAATAISVGMSDSKFRHIISDEIREKIVPYCERLFELCDSDKYISVTFEIKTDTKLSDIVAHYKKNKKEKK